MSGKEKVCAAGTLPPRLLDQSSIWIDTGGYAHRLVELDEEEVLGVFDFILANAKKLRDAWGIETKQIFDTNERARRWILRRPIMLALMELLVQYRREANILLERREKYPLDFSNVKWSKDELA